MVHCSSPVTKGDGEPEPASRAATVAGVEDCYGSRHRGPPPPTAGVEGCYGQQPASLRAAAGVATGSSRRRYGQQLVLLQFLFCKSNNTSHTVVLTEPYANG